MLVIGLRNLMTVRSEIDVQMVDSVLVLGCQMSMTEGDPLQACDGQGGDTEQHSHQGVERAAS